MIPSSSGQMSNRSLALAATATIMVSAMVAAVAFDGLIWLPFQPGGVNPDVRWAMARLRSWRGSTRASATNDLRTRGPAAVAAAPVLVEHLDDTGWADFHQGMGTMFAFHSGPDLAWVARRKAKS